jgi:type 1 glutamine amidotransferase
MPDSTDGKKDLSRRGLFGTIAAGAAAATALPLIARAQPAAAPAGRGAAPAAGRGTVDISDDSAPLTHYGAGDPIPSESLDGQPTQGGTGPVRVLFISSYHPFDRQNLFLMLDSFGHEISWCHIEHPAAERFFDPAIAEDFDVFLFYDAFAGRKQRIPGAPAFRGIDQYAVPSPKLQANLKQLLTNGDKAFVMLHHSLASWCHTWPAGVNGSNAYVEMMGGCADWGLEFENIRGKDYPASGYRQGTEQRITIVDKTHPITQGVDDFDIVDEAYLCPMFEDSVHPLLRSSFHPTVEKFDDAPSGAHCGPGHPPGSNMTGWVKTAENTPVVYIQHGHDNNAWSHPHYRRLVLNAIRWGATAEAKAWAKANSKRIFV